MDQDTSGWSGIFFLDSKTEGTVYGKVTLPAGFSVEEGQTLTIPAGAVLTVPAGMTLTVNGEIKNNGTIICEGAISGADKISGTGTIKYPQPEPTPEEPEEEEVYIPSEPISDGIHEYSLGKMLYIDSKRVKGLYEYENATYYFNEQGFMQAETWVELEDGWRYFGEDGKMATGWLQLGNAWYYLDPETGLMLNDGLHTIGKSTYYFHNWGGMASDWWYEAEDGWYFFGGSGAMKAACWLQWKGDWYYLTETGKMAVNADIGGYTVDGNGLWVQ